MKELSLEEMASLRGGHDHKKHGPRFDVQAKNIAIVVQVAVASASGKYSTAVAENNATVTQS